MGQHNYKDAKLIEKAVSSKNLVGRATSNQRYAKGDFGLWSSSLLERLQFSSVLDVSCGTGNQLVLYAKRPEVTSIVGVDVSKEALNIARERLDKIPSGPRLILKAVKMEEMFLEPEIKDLQFDLATCFYGLYYSQDVKSTLRDLIDHLSIKGTIVIVGPYGDNNANFFGLLKRHFTLPELVVRSSTTFMEQEVYPLLLERCSVEEEAFVNPICYPNAKSLIDYWRASTFYFPEYEDRVVRDIEDYFSAEHPHKEFVIEKHVKAYIGRKVK